MALQKSCAFGKIVKRYSIDSTPQIEQNRTKVTCRGSGMRSRTGGMWVARDDLHLRMGGVIIVLTLCIKRRCQLVVRLQANKCYQELLRFLFSYINLINIKLFAQVPGLCVSATGNVTFTTPGFVLIVLLVISLWLYCSGRSVDYIALIASLWPYR